MTYKEMLKQKPEDLLKKLKDLFAPKKDKSAMQSAIQNTFIELSELKEEIQKNYAENIGKFADIMETQMETYEQLRIKEFILKHLQEDYREMWGKDYKLDSDEDDD
jgi:hypothetical protein